MKFNIEELRSVCNRYSGSVSTNIGESTSIDLNIAVDKKYQNGSKKIL